MQKSFRYIQLKRGHQKNVFNEYITYSHVSITKISNIKRDILTTLSFWDIKMHIEIVMNGKYPDDRNWRKKIKYRFNILDIEKRWILVRNIPS